MKKFILSNTSFYIYGIFLVFGIWFLISFTYGAGNLLFPSPIETFKALGSLFREKDIYISLGWSLLKTLIGFLSAFIIALILGSIAGNIKKIQLLLKPLIIVFKSAPVAAFVFLFLVLIGSSWAPIFIVFLIAFPILYESVVGGINNIDPIYLDAAKLDSKSYFRTLIYIKMPLSLPFIIVGLASSFALSFKTEIMAEIITGSTAGGLGTLIYAQRQIDPSNLAPIFAITLLAIIIILIVDLMGYLIKKHVKVMN